MFPPPYTTILLHTVYCIHCVHCVLWFDLFVSKTMSPPPYTTIPLHTASSGLTFLHERQCPYHHIPLFYCVLCTAYSVHRILWFDLFVSKTMSPPPDTTILLHPLRTVSTVHCVHCVTASTESTGLTFLHQRQCPHHHIPLLYCVLCTVYCVFCPLRPLVRPFCIKDNVPTTIYHYSTAYCILWFDLFA